MKRALLCLVALMEAYCARYTAKLMAHGVHEDLNAYREDLMSSCMAMHGVPYASKAPASESTRASTRQVPSNVRRGLHRERASR